jgi:hypothetical protein
VSGAGDTGWDITIRRAGGLPDALVTVRAGRVCVDPPDAANDPFVAAAGAEIERGLRRPRARPACAPDPRRPGPGGA